MHNEKGKSHNLCRTGLESRTVPSNPTKMKVTNFYILGGHLCCRRETVYDPQTADAKHLPTADGHIFHTPVKSMLGHLVEEPCATCVG